MSNYIQTANTEIVKPCGNLYSNAEVCLQTTPSRLLATKEVLITSTVGVKVVLNASLFGATVEGFPTPSLSKHAGNPDYTAIKYCHQTPDGKHSVSQDRPWQRAEWLPRGFPYTQSISSYLQHPLCLPIRPGDNDNHTSIDANQEG